MDPTDLRMTLAVAVVLTAAALIAFIDYRRKRQQQQLQRIKTSNAASSRRPSKTSNTAPIEYAPAKKVIFERLSEPLVATATASRPQVEPRIERETVTVAIAPSSAAAPACSTENQFPEIALPAFTIDAALWERLISSQPKQALLSTTPTRELNPATTIEATRYMIQEDGRQIAPAGQPHGLVHQPHGTSQQPHGTSQQPHGTQPHGIIQQPAFEELVSRREPFTGLVISIGINDSDSSMWHSKGLMQSVGSYIATLLKDKDFCCRTGYDEFVMVCPGEQGAQSQHRLNHISERLWDYQLRGIGACSILFSWGGVQVHNQPLDEAMAAATDRMRQTKRGGHSAESAIAHRQAV